MANWTGLFGRWLEFLALCQVGNDRRHDKCEELIRICLIDIADYWAAHLPSPTASPPKFSEFGAPLRE
jgi:hypothetical protein